ncbi:MAG: Wzz/FepE/Etk N-terminal domain-containing protein [Cetobacterium sp.]
MEQKLQVVEHRYDEDEIDLYELIEILVRHKMTIVITAIVCTLLSLGAALYARSQKDNYLMKDIVILQPTINLDKDGETKDYILKGLNVIQPESILLRNNNVKQLLEVDRVKDEYLSSTSKEFQNINSERKFLRDIVTIIKDPKRPDYVTIKAKIVGNEEATQELIEKYIGMIAAESNLKDLVEEEIVVKKSELNKTAEEIDKMENELTNIFRNDTELRSLKPEEKINYLNLKYPTLMLKKLELEKYYNSYSNDLIKLNNMNVRYRAVRDASDIYLEEGKSKAKLILAVGSVLGVFLGMMLAFLKEFIEGYKKRYQK